jgi:kynureninase
MSASPAAETAEALDSADTLAPVRAQFALPRAADGTPLIYLCGHSLGLAPLTARTRVMEELADWERLGVLGHEHARRPWVSYAEQLQAGLARLTGAQTDEVVAMNSLTVNLHLLLAGFYRPAGRRRRILIEAGAFPSDRHVVSSQLAWHGADPQTELIEAAPRAGEDLLRIEDLEALIDAQREQLALILWPGVQYRTGQAFDLARLARAAHDAGALLCVDLAHAIGNLPLALHDWNIDCAAWCSYKYLNAGPGAIGGAFVHRRHHDDRARPHLAGWWGHDAGSRFQMDARFIPGAGAAAWQLSNPPILSSAPLLASLAIFDAAGLPTLRAKSVRLTGFLWQRLQELCGARLQCVTPMPDAERGCQLSIRVHGGAARARRVHELLRQRHVIADWREPDIIRIAPAPLYNRFADAELAAHAFADSLRAAG